MKIIYSEPKRKTVPFQLLDPGTVFSIPIKDKANDREEAPVLYLKISTEEEENAFNMRAKEKTQVGMDADCIQYEATLKVEKRNL